MATFTNGRVTLKDDLVFGPCVLAHTGWFPINQLSVEDARTVSRALDFNPTCPDNLKRAVAEAANPQHAVNSPHSE
jgi:hypothetical protein